LLRVTVIGNIVLPGLWISNNHPDDKLRCVIYFKLVSLN
jgi:hypothetical protein